LALGQCIMHMVRCGPRYVFCACSPLQDLGLCPPTVITFGEHLWVGTSGSLSGTVSRPHYPNYNTSHVCFSMNGNGVDLSRLNKLSIHLHGCKWRVYETGVSGLGDCRSPPAPNDEGSVLGAVRQRIGRCTLHSAYGGGMLCGLAHSRPTSSRYAAGCMHVCGGSNTNACLCAAAVPPRHLTRLSDQPALRTHVVPHASVQCRRGCS
jgi:hypothetical protein